MTASVNALAVISNLVAALALISVATVIVDLLMVYVMPKRKEYQDAKYQETTLFNEDKASIDDRIRPDSNFDTHLRDKTAYVVAIDRPAMKPVQPPHDTGIYTPVNLQFSQPPANMRFESGVQEGRYH